MIYSIVTLSSVLWLLWWLLIFAMCLTLYRAVPLPTLRWIAVYYAVGIVAVPVMQYFGHRIALSGHVPEATSNGGLPDSFLHSPLALTACVATTLDYAGDLLILILAFSEAAVLVRRVYPEIHSRLLQCLILAHAHTRTIGIVAVILAALLPVPAMLYFYTHP